MYGLINKIEDLNEQVIENTYEIKKLTENLNKKIQLDIEEKSEHIRIKDIQPPIIAHYNGKEIVKFPCDPRYCTSCMACKQVCTQNAISFVVDEEGFYSIKVDEKRCIGCKLCIKKCHVNTSNNVLLRKPTKLLAAVSKNNYLRINSSSGGIFSEISKLFLNNGGVVYGAAFDNDFSVHHIMIESEKELYKLRGSKYVQSNTDGIFENVRVQLDRKKKVLFSGTPCQIAGLKKYIGYNSNLYTIDILCHGVVSPMFWKDYLLNLEHIYGKIKSVNFRSKINGWKEYSMDIKFESGENYIGGRLEDPYTKSFLLDFANKQTCHRCEYAREERVGDITLGDFWGFKESFNGVLKDDDKGISAMMINSQKGEHLLDMISSDVSTEQRDICYLKKTNRTLEFPSKINPDRNQFWEDYIGYGYDYVCTKWLNG